MKRKTIQFLTTPLVTLLGIALAFALILLSAIGLLFASLVEASKYLSGLLESSQKDQVFSINKPIISTIPLIKNQ